MPQEAVEAKILAGLKRGQQIQAPCMVGTERTGEQIPEKYTGKGPENTSTS